LAPTIATAQLASASPAHQERYCQPANAAVVEFYAQVNVKGVKNLALLAAKAEAAATALVLCARRGAAGSTVENDRLYIRAADALFIAAEARHRLGQNEARMGELQTIVQVISRVDSKARTRSNERLYREARLLLRFTRHFAAEARR